MLISNLHRNELQWKDLLKISYVAATIQTPELLKGVVRLFGVNRFELALSQAKNFNYKLLKLYVILHSQNNSYGDRSVRWKHHGRITELLFFFPPTSTLYLHYKSSRLNTAMYCLPVAILNLKSCAWTKDILSNLCAMGSCVSYNSQ